MLGARAKTKVRLSARKLASNSSAGVLIAPGSGTAAAKSRPFAREATAAFAALRASFVKAQDRDEARLSLTTLPTFGTSWLTPRLGLFRARQSPRPWPLNCRTRGTLPGARSFSTHDPAKYRCPT